MIGLPPIILPDESGGGASSSKRTRKMPGYETFGPSSALECQESQGYGLSDATYAATAKMSSSDRFATMGRIFFAPGPMRVICLKSLI